MFTLENYKEELGKPYSKIYLQLCSVECFERANSGLLARSDDDDDKLDEMQHSVFKSLTSIHTPSVVEGKQSLSTQPSIVPFLIVDGNEETTSQSKVVCPLCFDRFNPDEIAQHADKCADQFDPVGTDNDKENDELVMLWRFQIVQVNWKIRMLILPLKTLRKLLYQNCVQTLTRKVQVELVYEEDMHFKIMWPTGRN